MIIGLIKFIFWLSIILSPILYFTNKRIKNYTLIRYLANTILFVVIWCIPAFLFVGYSLSVNGTRPSGIAGAGGIIAIFISYALVKRINKSNLWASLFNETEIVEKKKPYYNADLDMSLLSKKKPVKSDSNPYKKENNISDLADNLTKLGELKEKGLLTEEEFNEQKKKLLKQ
jgi:hypothetical protein